MKGRWLLLVSLCGLLLGLTGCATPSGRASAPDGLRTETDEPDSLKRARLRMALASGYFDNGQYLVALEETQLALAADPKHVPAYVLRGLAHMRLNNDRLAEESFVQALQIDPTDPDALHNHGWHLCQQGRAAQSLAFFTRALSLPAHVGQAKTWMAQGVCQLRMGQHADAETSLRRSHELDPEHPVTVYNLAALLFQRHEDQQARSYIQPLNRSSLANAQTLWLGLRVERRLRNTDAMNPLARQLGERFAASPEWALYQRGAFDE